VGDILLENSVSEDVRVLTAEVQALVGLRMTAFLADLESVVDLHGRLEKDDGFTDDGLRSRLRLVLDLAGQFREFNAITRFKAWLREVDAGPGGASPAALIRYSGDSALHARLAVAADRYLRGLAGHPGNDAASSRIRAASRWTTGRSPILGSSTA
jgi:hypothetical protein